MFGNRFSSSTSCSKSLHETEFGRSNPSHSCCVLKVATQPFKSMLPALYQLLDSFHDKSGVRALLNTSLNYFDEPIACTPRDALKTFFASGLDMLVMEGFVLTKS